MSWSATSIPKLRSRKVAKRTRSAESMIPVETSSERRLPLIHRLELAVAFDLGSRVGLDSGVIQGQVQCVGVGLSDMERAVDETLEAVAFRVVEVHRPCVAVVDGDDALDPRLVEASSDITKVTEVARAERHVIDHDELVV